MAMLSASERQVIGKIIDAFRAPTCATSAAAATARGVRFVEDLAAAGSERVEEIRRILNFLKIALFPLALMDRRAVRMRLTELENRTVLFGIGGDEQRGLARFAQRLAYICLYGALDAQGRPAAAQQLGYEVYEQRPGASTKPLPKEPVLPPSVFADATNGLPAHVHDVVIVGSGSAGSVLARRLVEDHRLDVAIVEIGDYVPEGRDTVLPGGRRPLVHDELDNLLRYYKHAGLQLTEGVRMFVFQGQCLGGTSVVNTAVCFRMRDATRPEWVARGAAWAAAGGALDAAYERIQRDVGIGPADLRAQRLNPSVKFLTTGAAALGLAAPVACDVNVAHDPDCLGCGYCNLVCGYLRKNSVLQTMLPAAARAAAAGNGKLTIYTGMKALLVEGGGTPFRPTGVRVRGRTPATRHQQGVIRGKKVVVCAGAIGSTCLLERTEAIRDSGLPLGDHLSCNFGSPVHAEYEAPVRAFDGLQIGHWWQPDPGEGFVVETWFNPPATQALALPGWMDAMQWNIESYSHLACAAPLVGSSALSSVDASWHTSGDDIQIQLDGEDLRKLKAGLKAVCRLFFAGTPKPRRVLLGTLDEWHVTEESYAERIDRLQSFRDVQVGTGHPMGGNAVGLAPDHASAPGVVDGSFRVFGTTNLFVVDASVFPTSLGVNPHWTVMAVADVAAPIIAAE